MAAPQFQDLTDLLYRIDEPHRRSCFQLLQAEAETWLQVRGSKSNHQTWPGGYWDHVQETMNIATILYPVLDGTRRLPFSESDALLVLYLHDLEKPAKYMVVNGEWVIIEALRDRKRIKEFVDKKLEFYGFELTPEHRNGLAYVEGEHEDYSPSRRAQQPLAAFAHMCDVWSARGWHDQPDPAVSRRPSLHDVWSACARYWESTKSR